MLGLGDHMLLLPQLVKFEFEFILLPHKLLSLLPL